MKPMKLLAFGLLWVGISLAAAYGSRNGPTHVEYRLAQGELELIAEELAELEASLPDKEALPALETPVPEPTLTLPERPEAPDEVGPPEPQDLTERKPAPRPKPKAVKDPVLERIEVLTARQEVLEAVTLPTPMDRLKEWFSVGGIGWAAGVVLIVLGALLARRQEQAEMSGEDGLGGDAVDFHATLEEITVRMERLSELLEELPMDQDSAEARELIDGIFTDLVEPLVDQRGRFMARHGLGTFAEYFGAFAGGERNLARTWSAITDGHSEEARDAFQRSRDSFNQSEEAWVAAESAR